MTHQRNVPAFAQSLPSVRGFRRRGRHCNYERNDSYDLEHTHPRFEVASPERGTRNVGKRYGVYSLKADRRSASGGRTGRYAFGADYAVNLSPTI